MDRRLIVVARNHLALCDYLRQQLFGDEKVEVILDRRWGERRKGVLPHEQERRRADRRPEPATEEELRTHGFAVIRQERDVFSFGEVEKLMAELHDQLGGRPAPGATLAIEEGPPAAGEGPSHGSGVRKGEVHLDSDGYGQDTADGQELLRKLELGGLRLPDNGMLSSHWQEFLHQRGEEQRDRQRIAKWMEERVRILPVKAPTTSDMARYLVIASRDQPELCDRLTRDFSNDKTVQVLLDRRQGKRRQRLQPPEGERRRSDRRRYPEGWTIPVSKLYQGDRPCFLHLAEEPNPRKTTRRENGSSFFSRGQGTPSSSSAQG